MILALLCTLFEFPPTPETIANWSLGFSVGWLLLRMQNSRLKQNNEPNEAKMLVELRGTGESGGIPLRVYYKHTSIVGNG